MNSLKTLLFGTILAVTPVASYSQYEEFSNWEQSYQYEISANMFKAAGISNPKFFQRVAMDIRSHDKDNYVTPKPQLKYKSDGAIEKAVVEKVIARHGLTNKVQSTNFSDIYNSVTNLSDKLVAETIKEGFGENFGFLYLQSLAEENTNRAVSVIQKLGYMDPPRNIGWEAGYALSQFDNKKLKKIVLTKLYNKDKNLYRNIMKTLDHIEYSNRPEVIRENRKFIFGTDT